MISLKQHVDKEDFLDIDSLKKSEINNLLNLSQTILKRIEIGNSLLHVLTGHHLATLFFEESTRTRLAFTHAANMLGANVMDLPVSLASLKKGESIRNTLATLESNGVDMVVIRHPDAGAPYFAAKTLSVPVVNAGDGSHAHPTQTVTDLFTLKQILKRLDNTITVAIVGDVLYCRTARSNIIGLRKFGVNVKVFTPKPLLPQHWRLGSKVSNSSGFNGTFIASSLAEAISDCDAVMVWRMQQERHPRVSRLPVSLYKHYCRIDTARLQKFAKPNTIVMHPGPLNEYAEISPEVARSSNCSVNQQVRYGTIVRMAIISQLLKGKLE